MSMFNRLFSFNQALLSLLVPAFLFTGCVGFERPAPGSNYGKVPTKYAETIPARMSTVLKDPQSARYRFGVPQPAYLNNGWLYGGKVTWQGYLVYFYVNAKNSYGGYTGEEKWLALIRDENVSLVDSASNEQFLLLRKPY